MNIPIGLIDYHAINVYAFKVEKSVMRQKRNNIRPLYASSINKRSFCVWSCTSGFRVELNLLLNYLIYVRHCT